MRRDTPRPGERSRVKSPFGEVGRDPTSGQGLGESRESNGDGRFGLWRFPSPGFHSDGTPCSNMPYTNVRSINFVNATIFLYLQCFTLREYLSHDVSLIDL